MLSPPFSLDSIEVINMYEWSHTSSHTPVDDNLNNEFVANDRIFETNELQAFDYLAVSLFTLDF